jgi:hypothetical protein
MGIAFRTLRKWLGWSTEDALPNTEEGFSTHYQTFETLETRETVRADERIPILEDELKRMEAAKQQPPPVAEVQRNEQGINDLVVIEVRRDDEATERGTGGVELQGRDENNEHAMYAPATAPLRRFPIFFNKPGNKQYHKLLQQELFDPLRVQLVSPHEDNEWEPDFGIFVMFTSTPRVDGYVVLTELGRLTASVTCPIVILLHVGFGADFATAPLKHFPGAVEVLQFSTDSTRAALCHSNDNENNWQSLCRLTAPVLRPEGAPRAIEGLAF